MILVWGRKNVDQKIGSVADLCLICREIQLCNIYSINSTAHVYGGAIGKKELLGHKAVCLNCDTEVLVDATKFSIIKKLKKNIPVENAIAETFPNIKSYYKERIELERAISKRSSGIGSELRQQLILEPFEILSPNVERKLSQTQLDFKSFSYLAATIIFPILLFKVLESLTINSELVLYSVLGMFGILSLMTVYQFFSYKKRYLTSKIFPKLGACLSLLNPTQEELDLIFTKLSSLGHKITKRVNSQLLMNEISKANQPFKRDS